VRPLVAVGTHRYQRVLMVPWWWNTCQWPGAVRRHSEVRVRPQPGQHHPAETDLIRSGARAIRPSRTATGNVQSGDREQGMEVQYRQTQVHAGVP